MMVRTLFSLLALLFTLSACAAPAPAGPAIRVENAWARPAAAGPMAGMDATPEMQDMPGTAASQATSAAYFVIFNDGSEADALTGATSDAASTTGIHETRIENDVAQMLPVQRLEVPARGLVEFKPGSYHVMLVGLTRDLKEGDTLKLTLQFEKSGAITLDVPVRQEN